MEIDDFSYEENKRFSVEMSQDLVSDIQIVSLNGTKAGHGINISDSAEDGVVVGSVEYGSPAHQSDKIAKGDKILSLTIDADKVSPEAFQAILRTASAYPVRLDVQRRNDLLPNDVHAAPVYVDVNCHPRSTAIDTAENTEIFDAGQVANANGPCSSFGYVEVSSPEELDLDLDIPRSSLDEDAVDVQFPAPYLAADGEVPSAEMILADNDETVNLEVDNGGPPAVDMATLDAMFQVDREEEPFDMDKPALIMNGPLHTDFSEETNGELDMTPTEMVLDGNVDPSTLDAVPGEDVNIVEITVTRIESQPFSDDMDYTTADVEVEVGIARIENVHVESVDLPNAQLKHSEGLVEELLEPRTSVEKCEEKGVEENANMETLKLQLVGVPDSGGFVGELRAPRVTVEKCEDKDRLSNEPDLRMDDSVEVTVLQLEPSREFDGLTDGEQETKVSTVAAVHQTPTDDVIVAVVSSDVNAEATPSSPLGYVKVVSPITATAPKAVDPHIPASVMRDEMEVKKGKKRPLSAKVKKMFKPDQEKIQTTLIIHETAVDYNSPASLGEVDVEVVSPDEVADVGFGNDLSADAIDKAFDIQVDLPHLRRGKLSAEKSQEAHLTDAPSDTDVDIPSMVQYNVERTTVEKCEDKETTVAVEISPEVYRGGKKKPRREVFSGIFRKKGKKKEKKIRTSGAEDVDVDDAEFVVVSTTIDGDDQAVPTQETVVLSSPVCQKPTLVMYSPSDDVIIEERVDIDVSKTRVITAAEPTSGIILLSEALSKGDLEMPEVQTTPQFVVQAERSLSGGTMSVEKSQDAYLPDITWDSEINTPPAELLNAEMQHNVDSAGILRPERTSTEKCEDKEAGVGSEPVIIFDQNLREVETETPEVQTISQFAVQAEVLDADYRRDDDNTVKIVGVDDGRASDLSVDVIDKIFGMQVELPNLERGKISAEKAQEAYVTDIPTDTQVHIPSAELLNAQYNVDSTGIFRPARASAEKCENKETSIAVQVSPEVRKDGKKKSRRALFGGIFSRKDKKKQKRKKYRLRP